MALTQVDQGLLGQYAQYTGFKNRIINGAMTISQRGASFSGFSDGAYTLDRYFANFNGGGVFSVTQSSDAPAGFTNSTLITVTTPDASIASTDYYIYTQRIEGYNVADLAFGSASASPVTVSFWVKSSVTGTYGVSVQGYNASYRTYVSTVTINSANTWEYKSFTVTGDTASVVRTNSNWGLSLAFDLGCGSAFNTTAGSWTAGEKYGTSGSTKLISTNGATFYITGVQLEKGSTATSFDYRPYGTELAMCQRYYEKGSWGVNGYIQSSGSNINMSIPFQVTKRATPTITYVVNSSGLANGSVSATDTYTYNVSANTNGGGSGNGFANGTFTASAEL